MIQRPVLMQIIAGPPTASDVNTNQSRYIVDMEKALDAAMAAVA